MLSPPPRLLPVLNFTNVVSVDAHSFLYVEHTPSVLWHVMIPTVRFITMSCCCNPMQLVQYCTILYHPKELSAVCKAFKSSSLSTQYYPNHTIVCTSESFKIWPASPYGIPFSTLLRKLFHKSFKIRLYYHPRSSNNNSLDSWNMITVSALYLRTSSVTFR